MAKQESDVVRSYNPPFYYRYVDDCFSKRKKVRPDEVLECLNSYHDFHCRRKPRPFPRHCIYLRYANKFNCRVFKKPRKLSTTLNQKSPPKRKKEILLLVPSTELTAFLSILMATSKQWNNLSKCGIPQACYFSHSEQFSTRSTRR